MKLTIRNWAKFQHYKDRSPPWIKLHGALLDDFEFQCLPIASKALAPMLWLLASRSEDASLPADPAHLAFMLRWPVEEVRAGLSPLIQKGLLVGDSTLLATCLQDAPPENREQRYREREKQDQEQAPQAREEPRSRGSRLPHDWQPSPADLDFIARERPELDARTVADAFRDFWHAKAGKDATKADWGATWRNWVRNQRGGVPNAATGPPRPAGGGLSKTGAFLAQLNQAITQAETGNGALVSGSDCEGVGLIGGPRLGSHAGRRGSAGDDQALDG